MGLTCFSIKTELSIHVKVEAFNCLLSIFKTTALSGTTLSFGFLLATTIVFAKSNTYRCYFPITVMHINPQSNSTETVEKGKQNNC
jgi:hypothetical protein